MDNIRKLERTNKGWWTLDEIASTLNLSPEAASVFKSRAIKRGDLIAIKRGICILPGWIEASTETQRFRLANTMQTPSYVSLLSALSAYGISSQIPLSVCESMNPVRSCRYNYKGFEFRYTVIPKGLFFGFVLKNGAFIAEPEKALVDAAYLTSLGRYALDEAALDLRKLNRLRLQEYSRKYPDRTGIHIDRMIERS